MELLVYITVPDEALARSLGRGLIEDGLAAGVNISGPALSIYRWQGAIHEKREWLLFAQCQESAFRRLEAWIQNRHPYQTPCIIAMEIKKGNKDFLAWIRN